MTVLHSMQQRLGQVLWYAANALLVLFFVFPLLFMVVSAFKTDEAQLLRDMASFRAFLPVGDIGWAHFAQVLGNTNFLRALANSVFVVGATVVLETSGAQEQEAMDALLALMTDKFGEGE